MLSLGRLQISYRLLIVLTSNLPNLEHLELINCASKFEEDNTKSNRQNVGNDGQLSKENNHSDRTNQHNINSNENTTTRHLPSLETFDRGEEGAILSQVKRSILTNVMYNQHTDEQINIQERLIRSTFVRNCNLIRETKRNGQWANLKHLLVKDCNLMNEFTLSLILSLTSQALVHLEIDKNQYLTGEFLNYCGPHLNVLKIRHCPSIRQTFVDDLVKIRKLLGSQIKFGTCHNQESSSTSLKFIAGATSCLVNP